MRKRKKRRKGQEDLPPAGGEVEAGVTAADEASPLQSEVMPEKAAPDERRYARFSVEGRTKGQVAAFCDALILNISLGGALIEHTHVVRPGTLSTLDLDLLGDTMRLTCRVVRSVVHRQEMRPYGGRELIYHTGLEFLNVTEEAQQRIGDYIQSILEQGKAMPTDGRSVPRRYICEKCKGSYEVGDSEVRPVSIGPQERPFDVEQAFSLNETYSDHSFLNPVLKYEVGIRYDNGDRIEGRFADKENAIQFLRTYQPPGFKPTP